MLLDPDPHFVRIWIQDSQMHADPDSQHCLHKGPLAPFPTMGDMQQSHLASQCHGTTIISIRLTEARRWGMREEEQSTPLPKTL